MAKRPKADPKAPLTPRQIARAHQNIRGDIRGIRAREDRGGKPELKEVLRVRHRAKKLKEGR